MIGEVATTDGSVDVADHLGGTETLETPVTPVTLGIPETREIRGIQETREMRMLTHQVAVTGTASARTDTEVAETAEIETGIAKEVAEEITAAMMAAGPLVAIVTSSMTVAAIDATVALEKSVIAMKTCLRRTVAVVVPLRRPRSESRHPIRPISFQSWSASVA
jgi:hypothetical protein